MSIPRPLALALLLALAACRGGGGDAPDPEAHASGDPGGSDPGADEAVLEATGIVKGVEPGERRITIDHGDIGDYMPAMTMPFYGDAALLDGLAPGDAVRFTFRKPTRGARHELVTIERR